MDLENFYVTPCISHDYHLMLVEYIKPQNIESVCTTREKEADRNTFFFKIKNKKNALLVGHRSGVSCCPFRRVPI
jgi:hypothetical protein